MDNQDKIIKEDQANESLLYKQHKGEAYMAIPHHKPKPVNIDQALKNLKINLAGTATYIPDDISF